MQSYFPKTKTNSFSENSFIKNKNILPFSLSNVKSQEDNRFHKFL